MKNAKKKEWLTQNPRGMWNSVCLMVLRKLEEVLEEVTFRYIDDLVFANNPAGIVASPTPSVGLKSPSMAKKLSVFHVPPKWNTACAIAEHGRFVYVIVVSMNSYHRRGFVRRDFVEPVRCLATL